jgi:hypothetical protein
MLRGYHRCTITNCLDEIKGKKTQAEKLSSIVYRTPLEPVNINPYPANVENWVSS